MIVASTPARGRMIHARAALAAVSLAVALSASAFWSSEARAQATCRNDMDCDGDLICVNSACVKQGAPVAATPPPVAPVVTPTAPAEGPPSSASAQTASSVQKSEGSQCYGNSDCGVGFACESFACKS